MLPQEGSAQIGCDVSCRYIPKEVSIFQNIMFYQFTHKTNQMSYCDTANTEEQGYVPFFKNLEATSKF
jgi:hypothetical protein